MQKTDTNYKVLPYMDAELNFCTLKGSEGCGYENLPKTFFITQYRINLSPLMHYEKSHLTRCKSSRNNTFSVN